MKIVYVLVCKENRDLIEQLLLSVHSLKTYNDYEALLLTDLETNSVISKTKLIDYFTEILPVEVPCQFDAVSKSRYIKTNLRSYISGDFLFIDIDTIITQRLPIEDLSCELGMVWDSHCVFTKHPYRDDINSKLTRIGARINNETKNGYFNSGVMYVKDTEDTHKFFNVWHAEWLSNRDNDIVIDQPFLVKTQMQFPDLIQSISGLWNCQLRCGVNYLTGAYILHFLGAQSHSLISTKDFLHYVKINGIDKKVSEVLLNAKSSIPESHCIIYDEDFYFYCSEEYKECKDLYKKKFSNVKLAEFFLNKHLILCKNKLKRRLVRLIIKILRKLE